VYLNVKCVIATRSYDLFIYILNIATFVKNGKYTIFTLKMSFPLGDLTFKPPGYATASDCDEEETSTSLVAVILASR